MLTKPNPNQTWGLILDVTPVYVPILTYGHECWIMNEKVRSGVQAAEMGFLRKIISGLTLLDEVKSADIRESLNTKALLLRLERSQLLRWYGRVTRISQERTSPSSKYNEHIVIAL